ncbi:hypothetical protein GF312_11775 [Candidatus Poribacteria bacterium]|nr:hypothetical protein [Candidatus Poribacteria bacterium]
MNISKKHIYFALILLIFIVSSCSEEYPFEDQSGVPEIRPGAMYAKDFPTGSGTEWTYVSLVDGFSYTSTVAGNKNLGGYAVRIMEADANIPVNHIGALYGFPVYHSFFTKDTDSYVEHGFELWLDYVQDTFFQRNSPKRMLWSFPLYEGKEWEVSTSRTVPQFTYTRKVVSANNRVEVPAGVYDNVYYIEEYLSIADMSDERDILNKFWVASGVGVVKYEFVDSELDTTQVYELAKFK